VVPTAGGPAIWSEVENFFPGFQQPYRLSPSGRNKAVTENGVNQDTATARICTNGSITAAVKGRPVG